MKASASVLKTYKNKSGMNVHDASVAPFRPML
jgi:hypothetical protein